MEGQTRLFQTAFVVCRQGEIGGTNMKGSNRRRQNDRDCERGFKRKTLTIGVEAISKCDCSNLLSFLNWENPFFLSNHCILSFSPMNYNHATSYMYILFGVFL